jgi:uncharacterized membrane protein
METLKDERSLGQILKDLTSETSTLLRQEVDLAKTEISEKTSRVGTHVGALAAGGAVAFLGALALLFALIYGLTSLLDRFMSLRVAVWLAPLAVGLALAAVGYSMMKKARESLRHEGIAPKRTTESLQENKEWLKTRMH